MARARKTQTSKPRGRPTGSVRLSPQIERVILTYVEAGAADYVAAEAAGIDDRTFRDWVARGEGRHKTRSTTPQLQAFAGRVREARARSRAAREIEVASKDPKFWLTHMARSKPGREGWTEPVPDLEETDGGVNAPPSLEESAITMRVLVDAGVLSMRCTDPNCDCPHSPRAAHG